MLPIYDSAAAFAWYDRVMGCALCYLADEIGWCELATPMAGVNIGLSEVESVGQGGGATNVFEVADIDAAKAHLDAEGVRQDGDIQHVPGLVRLITLYDPDGHDFRAEERRVGKEGGSAVRQRGRPSH